VRIGIFKTNILFSLILGTVFLSACTNNDNNSHPAPPAITAELPPGAETELESPKEEEATLTTSERLAKMGCPSAGDLSGACIRKMAHKNSPKSPMWTQNSGFSKNVKGLWLLRQMYRANQDGTFKKMRGINHDLSKAGPMFIWNDIAKFRGFGDKDYESTSYQIQRTRDGAVRFEFERDSIFVIDTFVLECFVPTLMEGKKLLCVWYHQNPRTGSDEYNGYIEFDRKK